MSNIDKLGRQVQRYANFGVDMMEWADGGYVKHSDYLALLDELEARNKQITELSAGWGNCQQKMGVYCHAYEEAKEQIAKDVKIKARLCLESNSLFDRLRAAEKRIAEHHRVLSNLAAVARRYLPDYDEHPDIQAADDLLESAARISIKGSEQYGH